MAKLSRVSLERKKELEQPDTFITLAGKWLTWGKSHLNEVLIGCSVVLAILIGIVGYRFFSERSEMNASATLADYLAEYRGAFQSNGSEAALTKVESKFKELIDSRGGTVAGQIARMELANMYYLAGRYDPAITLAQQGLDAVGPDSILGMLMINGLAYSYEAKGDFESAIRHFRQLSDSGGVFTADALYHLGLLYSEVGKTEESERAFKAILENHSDSAYATIAKELTRG